MSLSDKENIGVRTCDEIADEICCLTPAQWIRLKKVALLYAPCGAMDADDLLQEAFRRALSGSRQCPKNVDVVKFLAEAMRSIADGENEKDERKPALVPVANHGEIDVGEIDPPDPVPSIEVRMLNAQENEALKSTVIKPAFPG